jgi:hypothetical protein
VLFVHCACHHSRLKPAFRFLLPLLHKLLLQPLQVSLPMRRQSVGLHCWKLQLSRLFTQKFFPLQYPLSFPKISQKP